MTRLPNWITEYSYNNLIHADLPGSDWRTTVNTQENTLTIIISDDSVTDTSNLNQAEICTAICKILIEHQITDVAWITNWEEASVLSDHLQKVILSISHQLGISETIIIINDLGEGIKPASDQIQFVRPPLWLYFTTFLYQGFEPDWLNRKRTIVYTPGKPFKSERICLLHDLIENPRIAPFLEYSLRPAMIDFNGPAHRAREQFTKHTDKDYDQWALDHAREIDLHNTTGYEGWWARGPLDQAVYDQGLILVTETWMGTPAFITEKTFIPICMGVPFITLDDRSLYYLHQLGFKTYQDQIDSSLYLGDDITEKVSRMISRIELMHTRLSDSEVIEIAQHNRGQVYKLMHVNQELIRKFLIPAFGSVFFNIFT